MKWFRRNQQINELELERAEWQADRMLLDADEAFANSLGVVRLPPVAHPDPVMQRRLGEFLAASSMAQRQQAIGPLLAQMQGPRPVYSQGALMGMIGSLGGIGGGIFGSRSS